MTTHIATALNNLKQHYDIHWISPADKPKHNSFQSWIQPKELEAFLLSHLLGCRCSLAAFPKKKIEMTSCEVNFAAAITNHIAKNAGFDLASHQHGFPRDLSAKETLEKVRNAIVAWENSPLFSIFAQYARLDQAQESAQRVKLLGSIFALFPQMTVDLSDQVVHRKMFAGGVYPRPLVANNFAADTVLLFVHAPIFGELAEKLLKDHLLHRNNVRVASPFSSAHAGVVITANNDLLSVQVSALTAKGWLLQSMGGWFHFEEHEGENDVNDQTSCHKMLHRLVAYDFSHARMQAVESKLYEKIAQRARAQAPEHRNQHRGEDQDAGYIIVPH